MFNCKLKSEEFFSQLDSTFKHYIYDVHTTTKKRQLNFKKLPSERERQQKKQEREKMINRETHIDTKIFCGSRMWLI